MISFKPFEYNGKWHVTDEFGCIVRNTNGKPFVYASYDAALIAAERDNAAQRAAEALFSNLRELMPEAPWRTVNGRLRVV